MTNDMTKAIEVLATGNLAKLSDSEKAAHYVSVCQSLGMNPLTKPFEYITLNGKLTLYARKDATDQLRRINNVSIEEPKISFQDTWIIVTVVARDKEGRTDADVGVVSKTDMQGNYGNALMKCITKAKRRVTLSICGLGMLDETEVETIPAAQVQAQVQEPAKALPESKQQAGGQHQSPPVEAAPAKVDMGELRKQLERTGWGWKKCVRAMNSADGTNYAETASPSDISQDQLGKFMGWLNTLVDKPAPATVAPVAPVAQPTEQAQADGENW